jgi:hypothetical protein
MSGAVIQGLNRGGGSAGGTIRQGLIAGRDAAAESDDA